MKYRPRDTKGKCVHFQQYSADSLDVYCDFNCSERAAFQCGGNSDRCVLNTDGRILSDVSRIAGLRAVCRSTGGG